MSTSNIDERLAEVLRLFLLPNYNVVSPTYLDLLLTHISDKTNGSKLLDSEHILLYRNWINEALKVWSGDWKPCQPVAVFVLRLAGFVGRNEHDFLSLKQDNVLDALCKVLDLHRDDLPASIKMAYTTMLSEFINHKNGRLWIEETGIWKDVVKFALHNHTLYVTRESQRFISTLLLQESQNTPFCSKIILSIVEPVMNNSLNGQIHASLEELYLDQNKLLCTSLNLITSIFENTLFVTMEKTIPDLFEKLGNLEMRIRALLEACVSTRFFQHIHKLWILLNIRTIKQSLNADTDLVDAESWDHFRQSLRFIHVLLLSKKYMIELVKTHKMCLLYWMKLQELHKFRLPFEHRFEHQAIALMITPLCMCIRSNYRKDRDFFEMFIDKLFDVTCHSVQRIIYSTKAVVCGSEDLPGEQICKTTVELLVELVDIMDRDLAIIGFQMMCHVLKNYVPDNCPTDSEPEPSTPHDQQIRPSRKSILDGDPIVEVPLLLSALLNGIAIMAEKFKFKWKECVETTCVLFLAEGIMKHPGVQSNLCVQALKLCKLAIQDFMPPNLALLIDCDSHMSGLGPTLYKRLHDPNWEVRDSVFEALNTIAIISEDKYPAFQDFLLVNQFLQLAMDIALTDGESYVRASALIFISTTVRINKLWNEKLSELDLPGKAIKLLNDESEAIVRREAVMLVKELYLHKKWPKSTIDEMNCVMAEAAVLDLHWEVKVNALQYWQHFITSHFTDQGMLDGSFPNMTFSKEHRKIVALNESEIKRRLNKALDELAKQKCLGVLLVTLEDESDFEVSKSAARIIGQLKSFLLKYKVNEPQAPFPSAKNSAILDSAYVKDVSNHSTSDGDALYEKSSSVIDEIVDANDANLLVSLYKNSMKMDGDNANAKKETLRSMSRITKEDFLQAILNNDIDAYIEERTRWLKTYTSSFESVLEDIITSNESKNVNSMDCY